MPTTLAMLDDNPDDLDIMSMAAEEVPGVTFTPTDDEDDLIAALAAGAARGDALGLLLDWHLPGDQSRRTLAAVRARPEVSLAYVMVNTGSDDPADRASALAAGADGYSVKPAGYDESVALVAELARLARPTR